MLHMLLRCPWVETIWFGGQLGLRMVGEGVSSFHQWLSDLINLTHNLQDRSRLLSVIAFSCWYIWKARCNYVFKASTIAPSQMDGKATLVAVLQNHNGQFIAAHKLSIGAPSVVFTEAMALLKGCELAAELGFRWSVAESDSLEVVFSLQESTLRLGNSFQGCRWSWVPRLANQSADRLASMTNLEMCGKTWVRRPPSSLVHIFNKDGLPFPP
ncbi:hypothetical protein PS2_010026 [Malus domestica]